LPLKPRFLIVFVSLLATLYLKQVGRQRYPENRLVKRSELLVEGRALINKSVSSLDQCQRVVTLPGILDEDAACNGILKHVHETLAQSNEGREVWSSLTAGQAVSVENTRRNQLHPRSQK
jgi:hypothetical protein